MRFKAVCFTAILSFIAMGSAAYAQRGIPENKDEKPEVVWRSGLEVQVCEQLAGATVCQDGRMPAGLGRVEKVIAGSYVNSAKASWIALSTRGAGVCYLGSNNPVVRCLRIDVPADFANLDIDGAGDILYIKKKGAASIADTPYQSATDFSAALQRASAELQLDAIENDITPVGRQGFSVRMGGAPGSCSYERWRRWLCDDELPPDYVDPNIPKVEIIGQRESNCTTGSIAFCSVTPGGLDLAWASQKGFYVHQNAAKAMIGPSLTKEEVAILAKAQVFADSKQFQDAASTHRHAMRREGQSVEQANAEANDFVRRQFERAFNAPTRNDALFEFGIALHTLQDSTSPSHSGFQQWTGKEGLGETLSHVRPELTNPGVGSNLYEATKEAWQWFLNKQVPPGDLFQFGCDGCKLTGQG